MPFRRSAERSLGSPSPDALLRAVRGRCFCCGSSVLHVVMSVCMFGAVQFSIFLFGLFCVSGSFVSVMVTELPPVWERAANSAYHL